MYRVLKCLSLYFQLFKVAPLSPLVTLSLFLVYVFLLTARSLIHLGFVWKTPLILIKRWLQLNTRLLVNLSCFDQGPWQAGFHAHVMCRVFPKKTPAYYLLQSLVLQLFWIVHRWTFVIGIGSRAEFDGLFITLEYNFIKLHTIEYKMPF